MDKEHNLSYLSKPSLYIDLDGVLTDFVLAYEEKTNENIHEHNKHNIGNSREALIDRLQGDFDFWADMKWTKYGEEFWSYIKYLKPTILTSPIKDRACYLGKLEWVRRNLGEDVPVILSNKKSLYARPNSILVDDYERNIDIWNKYDGTGIMYKNKLMYGIIVMLYDAFRDFIKLV